MVAQALDYASWVEKLQSKDIVSIYGRFLPGKNLADDFLQRFGQKLDEDGLNQSHQIIILAASLDDSTERIVSYLSERDIPINVLCFQVFANGNEKLLSRSWLLDPVLTQAIATSAPDGPNEPWNGEFYCSYGEGETRSWDDAVEFGFICGGGGAWYSRTLQLLGIGDRVWVKAPGFGFVGVGRVTGRAQPASAFMVNTPNGELPVLEVAKRGNYHREYLNDPERCEYFVPIKWIQTVPLGNAVQEIGLFGNQNTVCKPTASKWRSTVERLKEKFPLFNKEGAIVEAEGESPQYKEPNRLPRSLDNVDLKNDKKQCEIILEVGAEGGRVTLFGLRTEKGWIFSREVIDQTPEFIDESGIMHTSKAVDSWSNALKLLDQYPWHSFYPLTIHPEFRERVFNAVVERCKAENGENPINLSNWEQLCCSADTVLKDNQK